MNLSKIRLKLLPEIKMSATITLVIAVFVAYIFNYYRRIAQTQWASQFPGPSLILPIVGNGWEIAGSPTNLVDFIARNFRKHGETWRFWVLNRPSILTADPKILKAVLGGNSHLDKHSMYDAIHAVLGKYSLILSRSEQWRQDRKIFNRAFHFALFESGVKSASDVWPITRSKIMSSNSRPMDVLEMFKHTVLHVVLKTLNVDKSSLDASNIQLVQEQLDCVLEVARVSIAKPWTKNPIYWKLFGCEDKVRMMRETSRTILHQFEEGCSKMNKANKLEEKIHCDGETTPNRNMSDILGDKTIPAEWKQDHFATIIGAATEGTAVGATMTLFFLALNSDCLKRVQEEVDSAFGSQNHLEQLTPTNLKYLKMCIKESMRLHAPVPLIGRKTSATLILEDGRKIPEGADIGIVVPEVHLNPEYFPDPYKFDPERFNEANVSKIKPFTYLPFSMGPRNCIGQKFSENSMPLILAPILKHFSISTLQKAEDIGTIYEIAGVPTPPVKIILTPRE